MAASISAIVCNFNHAGFLRESLDSYVAQSPAPHQLIVVDDASTDGSQALIKEYADRYPWMTVIWHERNQGWHASTRDALAMATGDFIYSGAADDYLLPGFFASATELAARYPQAGIVCGSFRCLSANGEFLGTTRWESLRGPQYVPAEVWREQVLKKVSPWNSLATATIFRRSAVAEVGGFRPELGFWADTFVIRSIGFRTGVAYLDRECTCFRTMESGMSGTAGRRPDVLLKVRAEALRLMRSAEFQSIFPESHVRWWAQATLREIDAVCSLSIDQHYQHILQPIFEATRTATGWRRWTLQSSRRVMSLLVRILRPLVGRQLRQQIESQLNRP